MLVRSFSETGGTGKTRSYWEPKIYRVNESIRELLVTYKIQSQHNQEPKVGILHKNHIVLCNKLLDTFNWNIKIDDEKKTLNKRGRPITNNPISENGEQSKIKAIQIQAGIVSWKKYKLYH